MTIIEIEAREGRRNIERQSHRRDCWMEGHIQVPPHLERAAWESGGYCQLVIREGRLVGLTPTEKPPQPQPEPTAEEDRDAMLVDLEYRTTLLELGV